MTQSLATRGRASLSPTMSMATAGMISTTFLIPESVSLPAGPGLRTTFFDPIPGLSVRKP